MSSSQSQLSENTLYDINAAIQAFKNGKPVIIMDDEDRENEGDICLPAQFTTDEDVLFMQDNTTGMLCVAINPVRAEELKLPPMTVNNTDPNGTPFTVTVDLHQRFGTSTGVSAFDRAKTIKALADPSYVADDFHRPGHVFPLTASPLGVRGRRGHTESSVDLCKLAGVYPACLIAELMHHEGEKKGEMMRADDCEAFGRKHDMPIVRIQDILDAMPQPKRKIGLVYGNTWHKENMNRMVDQIRKYFLDNPDFELVEKIVPAAFELVMGSSFLIESGCSAVIALGILRKGDTDHYEYIAGAVSTGLMNLQLTTKVPVVYGVLTCRTDQQIEERVSGSKNAVDDWCKAAVEMALH